MAPTSVTNRRVRTRPAPKSPPEDSLSVKASVVVTLTGMQLQLLRFFADQCKPPPVRLSRYAALHSQGLIYHEIGSTRYMITELGRQTVEALCSASLS
jgi:hypothetical protein